MLSFKQYLYNLQEATTMPSAGGGGITETHNGTRNQPLNQKLRTVIANGLAGTGLNWHSFSGGQPVSGPNRVGGPRHNGGNASDGEFKDVSGRSLDGDNPTDRAKIAQALSKLRQAGILGVGWDSSRTGKGHYMGSQRFHVDVYGPGVWGASKSSDSAAPWVIQALGGIPQGGTMSVGDTEEVASGTPAEGSTGSTDYESRLAAGQALETGLKGIFDFAGKVT